MALERMMCVAVERRVLLRAAFFLFLYLTFSQLAEAKLANKAILIIGPSGTYKTAAYDVIVNLNNGNWDYQDDFPFAMFSRPSTICNSTTQCTHLSTFTTLQGRNLVLIDLPGFDTSGKFNADELKIVLDQVLSQNRFDIELVIVTLWNSESESKLDYPVSEISRFLKITDLSDKPRLYLDMRTGRQTMNGVAKLPQHEYCKNVLDTFKLRQLDSDLKCDDSNQFLYSLVRKGSYFETLEEDRIDFTVPKYRVGFANFIKDVIKKSNLYDRFAEDSFLIPSYCPMYDLAEAELTFDKSIRDKIEYDPGFQSAYEHQIYLIQKNQRGDYNPGFAFMNGTSTSEQMLSLMSIFKEYCLGTKNYLCASIIDQLMKKDVLSEESQCSSLASGCSSMFSECFIHNLKRLNDYIYILPVSSMEAVVRNMHDNVLTIILAVFIVLHLVVVRIALSLATMFWGKLARLIWRE